MIEESTEEELLEQYDKFSKKTESNLTLLKEHSKVSVFVIATILFEIFRVLFSLVLYNRKQLECLRSLNDWEASKWNSKH